MLDADEAIVLSAILQGVNIAAVLDVPDAGYKSGEMLEIVATARRLYAHELDVDIVTIEAALPQYRNLLFDHFTLSVANLPTALTQLKARADTKTAIHTTQRLLEELNGATRPGDAIARYVPELSRYNNTDSEVIGVNELAILTEKALDATRKPEGLIESGFPLLDDRLDGLQPGELVVLAGGPSQGKTALALWITNHAVTKQSRRVLYVSLEMTAAELGVRLSACGADVDVRAYIHNPAGYPGIVKRINAYLQQLSEKALEVIDAGRVGVADIRTQLQRAVDNARPWELLVIDYLTLLDLPAGETQNLRVSAATRELKIMAKEYNLPILLLSQLKRINTDGRKKHATLSDLRDSGAIEQDANKVLFISHDKDATLGYPSKARLHLAKNRSGPLGVLELNFYRESQTFAAIDWAKQHNTEPTANQ